MIVLHTSMPVLRSMHISMLVWSSMLVLIPSYVLRSMLGNIMLRSMFPKTLSYVLPYVRMLCYLTMVILFYVSMLDQTNVMLSLCDGSYVMPCTYLPMLVLCTYLSMHFCCDYVMHLCYVMLCTYVSMQLCYAMLM